MPLQLSSPLLKALHGPSLNTKHFGMFRFYQALFVAWGFSIVVPSDSFQLRPPAPAIAAQSRKLNVAIHPIRSQSISSQLAMGVMEDFLSSADTSKRDTDNVKYLKSLQDRVSTINALESEIEELGDDELRAKTIEFRKRLQQQDEDIYGSIVEEAFAVVREVAWCVLNHRFL